MINDFDALEKRCRARRARRILKLSSMVAGSMLLALTGWVGWMQFSASTPSSAPAPVSSEPAIQETVIVPAETNETNATTSAVVQNSQTVLPVQKSAPLSIAAPTQSAIQKQPEPLTPQPSPVPAAPAPKKNLFEVTTSVVNAESLLMTYERSPRYENALALAKDFYSKADYANASVWAKKANQHNREAEEAWILSAKSYYAQGKKAEAIGVLELYLNYKDSKAATELLKTWKR